MKAIYEFQSKNKTKHTQIRLKKCTKKKLWDFKKKSKILQEKSFLKNSLFYQQRVESNLDLMRSNMILDFLYKKDSKPLSPVCKILPPSKWLLSRVLLKTLQLIFFSAKNLFFYKSRHLNPKDVPWNIQSLHLFVLFLLRGWKNKFELYENDFMKNPFVEMKRSCSSDKKKQTQEQVVFVGSKHNN